MRVAGSNCRARAFLLGEMATEVALGEEFVLVYVGDGGLRRCEVALLRREEAGLAGYVDLGGRASRRVRSGPATRRSRGREGKVDGIREESVYRPPLVTVLHTSGNGGVGWCNSGHSQELELSRALGSARAHSTSVATFHRGVRSMCKGGGNDSRGPMGSAEAQGRFYLQGNNKDGHFNSLEGRSRPARGMKEGRGNGVLKDRNCAGMSLVG